MDGPSFSSATKNLHANSPATLQPFLLFHTVLPQQSGSISAVLADQITPWVMLCTQDCHDTTAVTKFCTVST